MGGVLEFSNGGVTQYFCPHSVGRPLTEAVCCCLAKALRHFYGLVERRKVLKGEEATQKM